jgi:hypothetical protein
MPLQRYGNDSRGHGPWYMRKGKVPPADALYIKHLRARLLPEIMKRVILDGEGEPSATNARTPGSLPERERRWVAGWDLRLFTWSGLTCQSW